MSSTSKQQYQIRSPNSKVHGANMGPIWVRQDPGGPHVGPMNLAIWVSLILSAILLLHIEVPLLTEII